MAKAPKIETLAQVVDRVGGPTKVAEWLGISPAAVSNLKGRGRLAPEYWVCFVTQARSDGHPITYEYLAEVHASQFDMLPKGYKIQFA
jgi:DNA-binding transcriptional regulator YdaS (Cro superfamily)